jgi:hypothetical protein
MTEQQITNARLLTLRAMLKLEIKGMTRSRAPSAYSMLKSMGYKGTREAVLAKLDEVRQEMLTGVITSEA